MAVFLWKGCCVHPSFTPMLRNLLIRGRSGCKEFQTMESLQSCWPEPYPTELFWKLERVMMPYNLLIWLNCLGWCQSKIFVCNHFPLLKQVRPTLSFYTLAKCAPLCHPIVWRTGRPVGHRRYDCQRTLCWSLSCPEQILLDRPFRMAAFPL